MDTLRLYRGAPQPLDLVLGDRGDQNDAIMVRLVPSASDSGTDRPRAYCAGMHADVIVIRTSPSMLVMSRMVMRATGSVSLYLMSSRIALSVA